MKSPIDPNQLILTSNRDIQVGVYVGPQKTAPNWWTNHWDWGPGPADGSQDPSKLPPELRKLLKRCGSSEPEAKGQGVSGFLTGGGGFWWCVFFWGDGVCMYIYIFIVYLYIYIYRYIPRTRMTFFLEGWSGTRYIYKYGVKLYSSSWWYERYWYFIHLSLF